MHDTSRRLSESQQSEVFLRGRVEELEMSEASLRETLHHADAIMAQREKKTRDQVGGREGRVVFCTY